MFTVQPVRIYPRVPICEILYFSTMGELSEYNSEKYQNSRDIVPSKLFRELCPRTDPQLLLHFGQERSD
jgi:dCTP deaminase